MKFFQFVPTVTNFDFIGKFRYFMAFSIISAIAVIALILTKGFNYGIDFSGGTVMQVKYATATSPEEVRKEMAEIGDPEASVVALGESGMEYLITSRALSETEKKEPLSRRLETKVGKDKIQILKSDVVGPKVGAELKLAALLSLFYSVIVITIYIWFRFDFRFAPGATIAMLHDLILSSAFYLLSGHEFTITSIAALLTIAGYSVNDTIVVYDRVREIYKKAGTNLPLPETINKAINLTLSRTILTSGVTFISIIPIIFLCKGEIQSFAIAMCIGIFVGTYSTVYIASPFSIYVEKFLSKRGKGNNYSTAGA